MSERSAVYQANQPTKRKSRGTSDLEYLLIWQITAGKLPHPWREYRFHPTRRWRFDLAWPDQRLAVEVEGGIWTNGRHTRGAGMEEDMRKYNAAALLGWRVLRVSGRMIGNGEALNLITDALK